MKRINELSRDTLHSYVRKAADDLAYSSDKREDQKKREFVTPGMEKVRKHMVARTSKKIVQRAKGIHMATDKITKEEEENSMTEILDEATRKHFQAAAATIKAIEDPEKRKEHANVHAEIYAKQNPRFDRAKFLKAAGVNEEMDDEIVEDEDDEEISAAEAIVNAAVYENPVDLKDTFSATIGDRIASRISEIRDGMREKVFAPRQEEVETDDDKKKVVEGHSINQLKQAADHHRLHRTALLKQYMGNSKYANNEKDSDKAAKHFKATMAADKLRWKLNDAGKSHTSQLKK